MSSSSSPYVFNTFQKVLKQKGFQYTHSHFPGFNLSFHLVEIHEYRLSMWFWGPKLFEMKLLFHPGTSMSGETLQITNIWEVQEVPWQIYELRGSQFCLTFKHARTTTRDKMFNSFVLPPTSCSNMLSLTPFSLKLAPTGLSSLLNIIITYQSSSRTLLFIIAICYHLNFWHHTPTFLNHSPIPTDVDISSAPGWSAKKLFSGVIGAILLSGWDWRIYKLWMILNDMQHYICSRVLQKFSGQHKMHRSSHYEIHIIALNHSECSCARPHHLAYPKDYTLIKNQGSGKMHRVVLVIAARRKGAAADTNSRSKTVGVAVAGAAAEAAEAVAVAIAVGRWRY